MRGLHQVYTGSKDETVRVWDVETGNLTHELKGPQEAVRAVVFLPRHRLRVVSGGRQAFVPRPKGNYSPPAVQPPFLPLMVWDADLDRPK